MEGMSASSTWPICAKTAFPRRSPGHRHDFRVKFRRMTVDSRIAAGLFVLLLSTPASCQTASFVSGPSVSDLVCPNAPPVKPSGPHIPEPLGGTDIPSAEELGPLAHTVIRDEPVIDPARIPQFSIGETPLHVAVWGDSHIAAGPFMPTVQDILRARGLTVAAHFLPPTMGRANVRLSALHSYCIGHGWSSELAFTSPTPLRTGIGLINRIADAGPESYLWLDLRDKDRQPSVRKLTILYRADQEGSLAYMVNDGPEQTVALSASPDSQALVISGDALISTIKFRIAEGTVVLHGFILDYDAPPAVTFDVLGLPSATARGWANADTTYLAHSLHGIDYGGVVLEYGTNEGNTLQFDRGKYEAGLVAALANMRALFPHASCVLIGPPDRGVLMRHDAGSLPLLTFSRIHQQIESTQAEIGAQYNCVAWDWQDVMGGSGGSYGWALATPPLMGRDLTHLSRDGYKRSGEALARSLGWGTTPYPP